MLNVSRSTSQKTGVAPMYSTTLAVETHVKAGTITSSPGERPRTATARCRAVVHDVVAAACETPMWSANRSSKRATNGPCTTQPLCNGC